MSSYREWVAEHPLPPDDARRPTLARAATLVRGGEDLAFAVRELLDELSFAEPDGRAAAIAHEAMPTGDHRADVFLAALAEHLALRDHRPIPRWAQHPDRSLPVMWFVDATPGLRAYLLQRSPMAFRRRGILVDPASLVRV